MALVREEKIGDVVIQFPELTVRQIRDWLKGVSDTGDLVDATLFDEVSLNDLSILTSLSAEEIDGMRPSDLDKVIAITKEVNARFFAMRAKAVALGRKILESQTGGPSG